MGIPRLRQARGLVYRQRSPRIHLRAGRVYRLRDAFDTQFQAESIGAGLRFDFLRMFWRIIHARAPLRVEVWERS